MKNSSMHTYVSISTKNLISDSNFTFDDEFEPTLAHQTSLNRHT